MSTLAASEFTEELGYSEPEIAITTTQTSESCNVKLEEQRNINRKMLERSLNSGPAMSALEAAERMEKEFLTND